MRIKILFCTLILLSVHRSNATDETYAAMRSGDTERVQALLAKGISPNQHDDRSNTLLMQAAVYGHADALKLLMDKGADVNATNNAGATALMRAAGDTEKIRLLVEHGAKVNARSALGNTPLILAARAYGSANAVDFLLQHGAEVNATNGFGANAMLTAAASGDLETVRILLKHGADVSSHSRANQQAVLWGGGRSALMWAAARGDVNMAKLLLDSGADINSQEGFGTALTQAAWMDRFETAQFLLKLGANVNDQEKFSGFTALHWAASSENPGSALVDLLLKNGANVNAEGGEPVDAYLGIAQTPLMLARKRGDTEIVRALLAAGAKETAVNKKDANAWRELAESTDAKVIKSALQRSVPELQKSALSSRDAFVQHASKQDCVSCHQQYTPMAALAFAKGIGTEIDATAEEKLLSMVRRNASNLFDLTFEATFHPEPVHGYGYAAFGLAAQKEPANPEIDALIHHLLVVQGKDGSWYNNLPRPPIQTSDVGATALAVNALAKYGFPGRRQEIDQRIERARQWLSKVQPANTEERVWQLLGLIWSGEDTVKVQKLANALLKEQRADGGWSQLPKLQSDAYATGQALYALHLAGTKSQTAEFKRGVEYLLKTQREDGTWFVARRAFPFQPTMKSGFPYGRDSWVSSSGTSWAAIALAAGLEEHRYQASAEQ